MYKIVYIPIKNVYIENTKFVIFFEKLYTSFIQKSCTFFKNFGMLNIPNCLQFLRKCVH